MPLDEGPVRGSAKILLGKPRHLFQGLVVGVLDQAVVLRHAAGLLELPLHRAVELGHFFEAALCGLVAVEKAAVRPQRPAPVGGVGGGDHELGNLPLGFELAGEGREPAHGSRGDSADLPPLCLTPQGGEPPGDFHV